MSKLKAIRESKRKFDFSTNKLYECISKITINKGSKLLESFLKWDIKSDVVIVK